MQVLLADDQVWLRSALRLFLEHEPDIEVVGEVANAEALRDATASLHPDLIFLDWELPELKPARAARALVAALRAIQPHLYIIALCSQRETSNQPLTAGVDAVVSKAEPPNRLLAALRQAMVNGQGDQNDG